MGVHVPCASAYFYVSKLSETKIKDMSRRALGRCEIPGDKMEGKGEFRERKGNVASFLLFSGFFLFPPQEVYVDLQSLHQSVSGVYSHSFPYGGNHHHVKGQSFIWADITPGSS